MQYKAPELPPGVNALGYVEVDAECCNAGFPAERGGNPIRRIRLPTTEGSVVKVGTDVGPGDIALRRELRRQGISGYHAHIRAAKTMRITTKDRTLIVPRYFLEDHHKTFPDDGETHKELVNRTIEKTLLRRKEGVVPITFETFPDGDVIHPYPLEEVVLRGVVNRMAYPAEYRDIVTLRLVYGIYPEPVPEADSEDLELTRM
ncbi:MAG: hypothetical protein HYW25_05145 [Candidatus Aenigmarchaeota archaeon]|nr:hypothetical protein [Candidatus Aenigmarchaeota archaeon]